MTTHPTTEDQHSPPPQILLVSSPLPERCLSLLLCHLLSACCGYFVQRAKRLGMCVDTAQHETFHGALSHYPGTTRVTSTPYLTFS